MRSLPHTMERERLFLEEGLAAQIINRRMEAHARGPSAFVGGGVGAGRSRSIANTTSLSLYARDGNWRGALTEAYAIIGDALRAPPSAEEIAARAGQYPHRVAAAVAGRAHRPVAGPRRAVDRARSTTARCSASAQTVLDNFEANAPLMTPARIGAAMQALFTGSGPRLHAGRRRRR